MSIDGARWPASPRPFGMPGFRWTLGCVLLVGSLFDLRCLGAADGSLRKSVEKARQLLERGDNEGIVLLLTDPLLRGEARSGDAIVPEGFALLLTAAREIGDLETARTAARRGAQVTRDTGFVVAEIECLLEMRAADEARLTLESNRAALHQADASRLRELEGLCLQGLGRDDEARGHLEAALAAGRDGVRFQLGLIAFHRGDHAAATRHFEAATLRAPKDYYSRLYWGWSLLENNEPDAAIRAFRQAESVAPTAEIASFLGRAELRADRFAEAIAHFRRALKTDPTLSEAQFGLATALRRSGHGEEAKQWTDRFQQQHDQQQARLRKTLRISQRVEQHPEDTDAAMALGEQYLSAGDFEGAERVAWRALLRDPRFGPARLLLARFGVATGKFQMSAFHLRKIVNDSDGPVADTARRELAELIQRHGRRR